MRAFLLALVSYCEVYILFETFKTIFITFPEVEKRVENNTGCRVFLVNFNGILKLSHSTIHFKV